MKKLLTLVLIALLSTQITFAQDPGFYPPEGSTFNADSSEITLPDAIVGELYNETITFYATDSITIDVAGEAFALPFVSATITNVETPSGMEYSCNVEDCAFTPNMWGEVTLSGTPDSIGVYSLDLTAIVTINAAPLGLAMDVTFPIPYDGSNPILNLALGDDYSAINSFVPEFIINVLPNVGVEEIQTINNLVVSPNPASNQASFSFNNPNARTVNLKVFDLLGNIVCEESRYNAYDNQIINLNTTLFNNGVYIYSLSCGNNEIVGRLLINK